MLINAQNITIKYLDKVLFENASFVINDTDKIGLIGLNGAGKSTLLKAIVKEVELDSGIISYKKDLRIGYLPQLDSFNDMDTILEVIGKEKGIEEFEAKSILSKMGLNDYSRLISGMSGGEKKRLGLAIALSKPCDLLILDEPTNHLDVWMINWLEKYLTKFSKGLLLVTHDRYFLERVTKKTMEVDNHNIYFYDTNYSGFLKAKAERIESMEARERKLAALFKKEAAWAALNPQARTTKSTERLERFKNLEKDLQDARTSLRNNEDFTLSSISSRMGKTTIEIDNISKSINNKLLFKNFSYNVPRFDRLGIIGENGSGKTTLFKTILGLLKPDTGNIKIGETIKVGYFSQEDKTFKENIKIIDYIKSYGEYVDTINGRLSASQLLEQYLFSPNMQQMGINKLSGGEKRRLQLLTVLITNPNILFLDEPTNDLDIYTLDILENYLETFKGAVIIVSHDRYFLDKVCDHLLIFNNEELLNYNGIVSDYLKEDISKTKKQEKEETIVKQVEVPRFTSSEKREFDHIEENIMLAEEKVNELKKELSLQTTDYEKIMEINNKIEEVNKEIDHLMERWEYLSDINDRINIYKEKKYKGEI